MAGIMQTTIHKLSGKERLKRERDDERYWCAETATYKNYQLNDASKFIFNGVSCVLFVSAVAFTLFLFQLLSDGYYHYPAFFGGLLGIFFYVPALTFPMIVMLRITQYLKRVFVWIDIGRKVAEERGYYYGI